MRNGTVTPLRPQPRYACEAGRRIWFLMYPEWTEPCPRPGTEKLDMTSSAAPLRLCPAHATLLPSVMDRVRL